MQDAIDASQLGKLISKLPCGVDTVSAKGELGFLEEKGKE